MDDRQLLQHQEYEFPYHYLPRIADGSFQTYRNWSWSLQYVTALRLVMEKLGERRPASHVDIGCGDGALLSHVQRKFPEIDLVGIDYDQRSINLATVMSPEVRYIRRDIINEPSDQSFDSGSMVEVFEHIPPEISHEFLAAARRLLKPGATLLLTVPHQNVPLASKHYRHFSFDTLRESVSPHFTVANMFAFNRKTLASRLARLLARRSIFFESVHVNRLLLNQQLSHRSITEPGFQRIFAELIAA